MSGARDLLRDAIQIDIERGISKTQIARDAGLSRNTIYNILNGEKK